MRTGFINGKFYVEKGQFCQAILVEDNKIVKVGDNQQILSEQKDEIVDLEGKTVVPGFNDCHLHLSYYAKNQLCVVIDDCTSKDEVLNRCYKFIEKHPDCKYVYARGYNEDLFTDGRMFTREEVNAISDKIPVIIVRVCGHSCMCNDVALKAIGLTSEDGFLYEEECDRADTICEYDRDQLKASIIDSIKEAESLGITSIQSQDIDDFVRDGEIKTVLAEVYQDDKQLLRWHIQARFDCLEDFRTTVENDGYHMDCSSPKLTLGPLKLFKDGSLGAKTALLKDGYIDNKDNKGIEVNSFEKMNEYVKLAEAHGIQVITHAIGDEAIDSVCDSYILNMEKGNPNRHIMNHCQITDEPIMKKIAENKILIAYQPIFLEYDLHMVEKRVSENLAKTSYCFNTANKMGIICGYSTDNPVEPFNPFYNIHCAVNRQDLNGNPSTGYNPDESVSVEEAIDCYTIGSSYLQFTENEKGRIKEGYLADFVVLNKDIFTCESSQIKSIKPVMTYIDGLCVFCVKKNH